MQHPFQVTVHNSSIRDNFARLTKAHHLVLSGISSFADAATLLSRYFVDFPASVALHNTCLRSLQTLYVCSWFFDNEMWAYDWMPSSLASPFVTYHDFAGVEVKRYAISHYAEYWSTDIPTAMNNHREVRGWTVDVVLHCYSA